MTRNPAERSSSVRIPAMMIAAALASAAGACSTVLPLVGTESVKQEHAVSYAPRPPKDWQAAVSFRFYDTLRVGKAAWTPVVRFSDGGRARTILERDLTTQGYADPHTPWYQTRDTGTLAVEVVLQPRREQADTVRARLYLPLKKDNSWSLIIDVRDRDPLPICMGCQGSVAVPLRTRAGVVSPDSLWITWADFPISTEPPIT